MINLSEFFLAKRKSTLVTIKQNKNIPSISAITIKITANIDLYNFYILLKNLNYAFIDATVIDILDRANRFTLTYTFISLQETNLLYVKIPLNSLYPIVNTASNVFPAAFVVEREIYDMYGVFFQNHLDLRRILTDYSFKGNPLKKDFPLSGYTELRYSNIKKTLLFAPISLTQEFRAFSFENPYI